jgi:SOS response regulatory protein OraA/RecX
MTTIEELEKQKAELEKQIKEATKNQKQEDLKLVRQLCKRHGFTYSMLKNHLGEGRNRAKK